MKSIFIALMGGDGTGKTTISKETKTYFANKLISSVRITFFENHFLLKLPLKIFSCARKKIGESFFKAGRKPKNPFFKIWTVFILVDSFLVYYFLRIKERGKIVVSDRYPWSYLISWRFYKCSNRLIEKLYKIFPRPEIAVVLTYFPDKLIERISDRDYSGIETFNYDFFEFHIRENEKLAQELQIPLINNISKKQTMEKVVKEFRKYILSRFSFEDRFLLLLSNPLIDTEEILEKYQFVPHIKSFDLDFLIDKAVKNNVESIFLKNITGIDQFYKIFPSETWIRTKKNAFGRRRDMLAKTLLRLSNKFHEENIKYVVFKTLPDKFEYLATDVDILIAKRDSTKALEILRNLYGVDEKREFLHDSYCLESGEFLKVDFHTSIGWCSKNDINSQRILNNSRKVTKYNFNILVPSFEDELQVILEHSVFQHHYTSLHEFYYVISLLTEVDLDKFVENVKKDNCQSDQERIFNLLIAIVAFYDIIFFSDYSGILRKNKVIGSTTIDLFKVLQFQSVPFLHSISMIRKRDARQILDFFLYIARKWRFKINGKLPYNINWLNDDFKQSL